MARDAGVAGGVLAIRRHLVEGCGIDRQAITFMGYRRHGKVQGPSRAAAADGPGRARAVSFAL